MYADGMLGIPVTAPTTSGTTQVVTVAGLSLASGTASASLAATVSPATPGKYNQGELLLSNGGQLVASASLNTVLASGGTVQVTGIPGSTATSLYYLTVRAWNSSNPSGTLSRQFYSTPVDLRSAASASAQLTVN
jgi:hypothetical protein